MRWFNWVYYCNRPARFLVFSNASSADPLACGLGAGPVAHMDAARMCRGAHAGMSLPARRHACVAAQLCSWGWQWRFYYISNPILLILHHAYLLCFSLGRPPCVSWPLLRCAFRSPCVFLMWHCWLLLLSAKVWGGNGTAFRLIA